MSYYRFHFLCLSIYFRELHFSMQFSRYTLVGPSGLEPPTSRLSGARSNQLSYEPSSGGDERVRTNDPRLIKTVL